MGWLGDVLDSIIGKPSPESTFNPGVIVGKTDPNMQIGIISIVNEGKIIKIYDDKGNVQNGTWINTGDTGFFSIPFRWDPAFNTGDVMNTSSSVATLLVTNQSGLGSYNRYIIAIGLVTNLRSFIEDGYSSNLSSKATGGLFKKMLEQADKFIKNNPALQGILGILKPHFSTQNYTLFSFIDTTNADTYQKG